MPLFPPVEPIFGVEFEIGGRAAAPDQKRILLRHHARLGLADDRAILHSPKRRIAVPALQSFAVENRTKSAPREPRGHEQERGTSFPAYGCGMPKPNAYNIPSSVPT